MYQLYISFRQTSVRIHAETIEFLYFANLATAILENMDEQYILALAITAINEESKGQTSLVPSESHTTYTKNNSEAPDFDRTALQLENVMKGDLDTNVFFNITNFWKVFFENKGWSEQTSRIWESYQKYEKAEKKERSKELKKSKEPDYIRDMENLHIAKEEKILEVHMKEREVWDWLNFFSETFLNQLKGPSPEPSKDYPIVIEEPFVQIKGQCCRTKVTGRAIQSTGKTQIDFLVKSIDLPKDGPADWENINVLGEFTITPMVDIRKKKFLQLSRCVREVFCAQPLRRFLHGFCLFEEEFELWVFDRSGAYSSGPKHIVRDKKMFVRAISSYLLMSDEELGRDTSIIQNGADNFVQFPGSVEVPGPSFNIKSKPIVQPMRLITRGTTCYESKDELRVIKYSWSSSEENTEVNFLNIAKSVRGVVNCLATEIVYETKSHLHNLNLSKALPWKLNAGEKFISKGIKLTGAPKQSLKRNRRLTRIAMTPRGRAIYSSGSILDFVAGIRDAIKGHEGLVGKEILHGDVSEGNIILLKPSPEEDLYGMLIDLDHSVKMKGNVALEDDRSLTGTMKFMALERLQHARDTGKSIGRTCRHDLESFFYVFIVGCIEYEDVSANEANDLNDWCTNDVKSNFKAKSYDIEHFDQEILKKFTNSFKGLKELAEKLRQILFHNDGRYIETPVDCGPLYDSMIKALDKTVEDIKAGRIENKIFKSRRK